MRWEILMYLSGMWKIFLHLYNHCSKEKRADQRVRIEMRSVCLWMPDTKIRHHYFTFILKYCMKYFSVCNVESSYCFVSYLFTLLCVFQNSNPNQTSWTYNSFMCYGTLQSHCGWLWNHRGRGLRNKTNMFFTSIEDAGAEAKGNEIPRAHVWEWKARKASAFMITLIR